MSTAEELLNAEMASADQAALTKAFNDAKRNDVKGLLKAQGEGRIYEYMDKWIPRDVKRRLSEERKKAPKLHTRRFNHAGKRAPLKRVTKNGSRNNGTVELSDACLSAFLAKEKAGGGGLSRGQVVTKQLAPQMAPRSSDGNTKKILEENKLLSQLTSSNIQDNLVTSNDNTNTKISSSRLSAAQETATTISTPSLLNNRENICPTSIQSEIKSNNATTSFKALRTNLKPIHGGKSNTRDPLSLRASSTNQNNMKVGTSTGHVGNRGAAAETRVHLQKVDKSSPSLSTSFNVRCTGSSDPAYFTDSENGKQKSHIGGVQLRPVRPRQELPTTIRSLGPKASPQRFPVSPEIATTPAPIVASLSTSSNSHNTTGACSIPRDDDNNAIRCDTVNVEKKFEAVVVSPVENKEKMKEAVPNSITSPPSETNNPEKKGNMKENASSSIMSSPQSSEKTNLETIGAVAPPPSSLKKEVSISTTGSFCDGLSKELEVAKHRTTSIQDDTVLRVEILPPPSFTLTPVTQDHMTTSAIRANNTSDHLFGHELNKVTEYSSEIEDVVVVAAGMKSLPTIEEDRTPTSSTPPLSGSDEPSRVLGGVTKYTTNIEDVVKAIDPKPSTAASLSSSSENTESAFIEYSEETGSTTKLGRLHAFFGNLFPFRKKKESSSKRGEMSSSLPSITNSSAAAAQDPSSQVEQEHHELEGGATCAATSLGATEDITTTTVEEQQPSTASVASSTTTVNVSTSLKRSFRFGKKLKKMTKRRKKTMTNAAADVSAAVPGVIPTTGEFDSSSVSLKKRLAPFGRNKPKKRTKRCKTTKSDIGSSVTTTDIPDGKITTTTNNTEEDHSVATAGADGTTTTIPAPAAAHEKCVSSKKNRTLILCRDKKMKRMKTSLSNSEKDTTWPTDCPVTSAKAKSSNTTTKCITTTDTTSIGSLSASSARKATESGLNGKKMKGKQRDGTERLSAMKSTAKNAASSNGSLPTAAADNNTPSTCSPMTVANAKPTTTLKGSRKKNKTKQNMIKKKSSPGDNNSSKRPYTIQQLSSINLASLAENALSKFMGEAKPKEITPQQRVAREQAAFERSQQQYKALRLPPAGLLGLRQMKLSSSHASVPKDSGMALDKSSFRRRLGIERKVSSKHHCNTEMFCEVQARMWHGHDKYDTGSSVWATQYIFLKLTEGVLWMGKAGAVMKEVALISKTCSNLSDIQYVEDDEDGKKGYVLVTIDDSGSCNGGRRKRYIQLCARTDKETKELHQLLSLSNGC